MPLFKKSWGQVRQEQAETKAAKHGGVLVETYQTTAGMRRAMQRMTEAGFTAQATVPNAKGGATITWVKK